MYRALALIALGIGIGIMIAPEKGAVIRKKLIDLIDELSGGEHFTKATEPAKMNITDETL